RFLPLVAVDAACADRRHSAAGLLLLCRHRYRAGSEPAGLAGLCRLAAVFTRGAGVAVLAALHSYGCSYRSDRRHSGLDLQHAAAVFGLPYGFAITAAVTSGGRT